MDNLQKLIEHFKKISHFEHLAAISHWDQAAMMPSGGADARAHALAELGLHIHHLKTLPQLEEWFAEAQQQQLNTTDTALLREMHNKWQQANVLPKDLVLAKSLAGSKCEHAWRTQRQNNDWQGFAKNWQEVVNLSQQEAQIRAEVNKCSPYDAMLNLYEPGTTSSQLNNVFSHVTQWLPQLVEEVLEKQKQEKILPPQGYYPIEKQKALGLEVMNFLQFDFNHGRLDESMHPFCGGVPSDVRLTTRYNEQEFTQSLMGIVHETGHARYEQGLPTQYAGNPVGEARSMGIHESQSLFFEMQIGRDSNFIQHLAQFAKQYFHGDEFSVENLSKLYTRVEKGFIRVDADELTYPAHVILRYEIERDLINGNISYFDIPDIWDNKMQQYLGLSTQGNFTNGCMQDIHWTDGSFGYFPSYTLGAMYAAQFMATIKQQVNVTEVIQRGDLTPIFRWLDTNIWKKGSLLTTDELVKQATGETLNPIHFKQHLIQRYL